MYSVPIIVFHILPHHGNHKAYDKSTHSQR